MNLPRFLKKQIEDYCDEYDTNKIHIGDTKTGVQAIIMYPNYLSIDKVNNTLISLLPIKAESSET